MFSGIYQVNQFTFIGSFNQQIIKNNFHLISKKSTFKGSTFWRKMEIKTNGFACSYFSLGK